MNNVLIATLAGMMTALCWGVSDWLSAKASKRLGPIQINFGLQIIGVIMVLILALFSDISMPSIGQLALIATSSTLITCAYLIFVKALETGAVGIIVPLANSYPLITILLSITILGRHFSVGQFIGILIIIIGAVVLAYEKNENKVPFKELHKETLLAGLAVLIWGVGFFAVDPVVDKISWQTLSFCSEIYAMFLATFLLVVSERRHTLVAAKNAISHRITLLIGLAGTGGAIFIYMGADYGGSIIIPAVMSSAGPLVASILGAVVDKETLGWVKRVGAVILIAGVIILNLT